MDLPRAETAGTANAPEGCAPLAIRVEVVEDAFGWSVRIGEHMHSPFRKREHAVLEAHHLAARLRWQGAKVVVEGVAPPESSWPAASRADRGALLA